jgi:integrase
MTNTLQPNAYPSEATGLVDPTLADGADKAEPVWVGCRTACLVRHSPTGVYYARKRANTRLFVRSLRTRSYTEAVSRLPALCAAIIEESKGGKRAKVASTPPTLKERLASVQTPPVTGNPTTLEEGLALFLRSTSIDSRFTPSTRDFRTASVVAIRKGCPWLLGRTSFTITVEDLQRYLQPVAETRSPAWHNTLRWTLGKAIDRMIARDRQQGMRPPPNPIGEIAKLGRRSVRETHMPTTEQFAKLLAYLDGRWPNAALTVRTMAFTGLRMHEAKRLEWGDIDMGARQLRSVCAKVQKTSSNPRFRFVPLIPEAYEHFRKLKTVLRPNVTDRVISIWSIAGHLKEACQAVGALPLRPHGLRHFFATRCIESGVDIPTVSRWLGHNDGGVMALKVYGHLRTEHSQMMAARVAIAMPAPPAPTQKFVPPPTWEDGTPYHGLPPKLTEDCFSPLPAVPPPIVSQEPRIPGFNS